ncbi:MAG: hypothetical protein GY821_16825 [Gammaproteobacteria bacterium]|nr:hypothetical protein [Gammaproteobacteria bacterium]
MEITFSQATLAYQEIIFSWLDEPHVKAFWDNSPAHREDIVHFMKGRETPSNYFDGIFNYWLGFIEADPYAFLLTSPYTEDQQMTALHSAHLSRTGRTYSIDFCIGNSAYLGKGHCQV